MCQPVPYRSLWIHALDRRLQERVAPAESAHSGRLWMESGTFSPHFYIWSTTPRPQGIPLKRLTLSILPYFPSNQQIPGDPCSHRQHSRQVASGDFRATRLWHLLSRDPSSHFTGCISAVASGDSGVADGH